MLEQIVVLITFALAIAGLVFAPTHLPLGIGRKKEGDPPWYQTKTVYVPILGVVFLFLAHVLLGALGIRLERVLAPGQVLDTVLSHYDIVFLILSFAFLSISLDRSGFFEFCSLRIVRFANGNGLKLLIFLYLLCSILTFFTSNDIVIISMTPIILYVGKHARIRNLIPLLLSQFIAANTLSMGLYIGSPTNIVLGDATEMTFRKFLGWMFFPSVVSCAVTLIMILLVFHFIPLRGNRMQAQFVVPERAMTVRSSFSMWVKVSIFAVCLLFLTISSEIHVDLWVICLAAAIIMLIYDICLLREHADSFPVFIKTISRRMPWPIAPFVLCFFSMVEALSRTGFTDRAAIALAQFGKGSILKLSLVFGYVSAFAVNFMNDIPSTVFWANMVKHSPGNEGALWKITQNVPHTHDLNFLRVPSSEAYSD